MSRKIIAILAAKAAVLVLFLAFGWGGFSLDTVLAEMPVKNPAPVQPIQTAKLNTFDEKEKGIVASLQQKEKELQAKEEEMRAWEERLTSLKSDIDSRVGELNKIHSRIDSLLKKIDEVNSERVKKIVKIYETMSPEEAAPRVEKLEDEMAVMILASMSEKKAAKILGAMEVRRSVHLSQSLKVKK